MSLKIPAPEPVCFQADCPVGTCFHGEHDYYFKFACPVPQWGILKSTRITVLRNGEQTNDIWMYDFGVTLSDGKILLSMQFNDPCGKPGDQE
jgi:hypothetical protein